MNKKNYYFYSLVITLMLLGCALTFYYHWKLGLPWQENKQESIWSVEAMVKFQAKDDTPIKVKLEIPSIEDTGFVILHENFISRNYGYTIQPKGNKRYAIWSIRRAHGLQTLYYRLDVHKLEAAANNKSNKGKRVRVQKALLEEVSNAEKLVMDDLLDFIRRHSSDIATFTAKTINVVNQKDNEKVNSLLKSQFKYDSSSLMINEKLQREDVALLIVKLLARANISAMPIRAIELSESSNVHPSIWIKAFDGKSWLYFDVTTGIEGLPDNVLPWGNDTSMLTIEGGGNQRIKFSVSKENISSINLAVDIGEKLHSKFISFSLFSLPLHIQHLYHILFLMPVGILIILLLRVFVGLETIGTFMPVLIALAFRDTQLVSGIILFVLVTAIGLLVRFNLEQIKLLIVPKLGFILTAVIILMAIISIISNKLEIESGLSIALFPMVILTMAIERLSILWEERGAGVAVKMGINSLFAASIAHLIMKIKCVNYLLFTFPGLLLVLMAFMLLCGRYRGYRLLELPRFIDFNKG